MKYLSAFLCLIFCNVAIAQIGQIDIPRVEEMPDSPSPYVMRDWKEVAKQYDALVFDQTLTGTHLPLISLKPFGRNFPNLQPIQMDTYVGTTSTTQAEAINIIPSIVGASLVGLNKADQNGINWVEKIKDFYNSANGQHVYLNGTNSSSGNDWWYDVMPNVFFYQTYSLYPSIPGFESQFVSVSDRWLDAVQAMGGSTTPWAAPFMNYRGWYLSSMTGNSGGVKEPEAAGSIAWLLYQAYRVTGEKKYLHGAQMSIEYLSGLTTNPSYELQLPYGTITAATLNAMLGAGYDVEKMLNWSFDRGALRGWGTIVGTWDGNDISGLIGEANDAGNDYAFMMNGYQHAAALAPVAKYDKRFARAIAKWILNLANASRFYYPAFRPADRQDDFEWSNAHDPSSVIGYEALKENWDGKALYATGDAKRSGWAATNLALYGSSHVGYLAAVIETTDIEKILQIDLNKTDFFADNVFPTVMVYNPHGSIQQVTLNQGVGPYDVYDAISETTIAEDVSGNFSVNILSDQVVLLTFIPAGTTTAVTQGKLYAGDHIVDYHYGYNFTPAFRIKSFDVDKIDAAFGDNVSFFATVENPASTVSYQWFVDDVFQSETASGEFSWTAPNIEGDVEMKVEITSDGKKLMDSLIISVVEVIPAEPIITAMTMDKQFYISGTSAKIIAQVENAETEDFTYEWFVPTTTFEQVDSLLTWTTSTEGLYAIRCVVTNRFGLSDEHTIYVLVKSESDEVTAPLAYYPLNLDVMDYSGNDYHAAVEGTQQADDALNIDDFAMRFSSSNDIVYVDSNPEFNFRDQITLSFWMSPGSAGHEAFLLSHGSWEERWKVSITPSKHLRWTVKTENGVADLDSSEPLTNNEYIHVAVVYSSYSMELYINGELDNYVGHGGLMTTTNKQVTFGQKDFADRQYYYNGVLDEVRVYDKALQPDEISLLQTLWHDEIPTSVVSEKRNLIHAFPNPSSDATITVAHPGERILHLQLFSSDGRNVTFEKSEIDGKTIVRPSQNRKGMFIVKVTSDSGISYLKVVFN